MSGEYMRRKVGQPRTMTCTNCGRRRAPVGRLILCQRCDSQVIMTMQRAGKDGDA